MVEEQLNIRLATLNDIPTLAALNAPVQQLHHDARPDRYKPAGRTFELDEFFRAQIEGENTDVYIAELDGRAVAYLQIQLKDAPETPFAHAMTTLYVHAISVNPEARRKGVGEALIQKAYELANAARAQRVALDTWAFNTGAQEFFEKMGFHKYNYRMESWLEDSDPALDSNDEHA